MFLFWMKIVFVGKKYFVFKYIDCFLIIDSIISIEIILIWIFVFVFKVCFDESLMC